MKRFAGLLVAGLIVGGSTFGSAAAAPTADQARAERYIVTLKADANPRAVAAIAGVDPLYVYDAALNGFAAELSQGQLTALRRHASVDTITPDGEVLLDSAIVSDATSQPPTTDHIGINAASNVTAYVIDTGIRTSSTEFGGRATNVYDAFGGTGQDCNGHGTYIASLIGGTVYGVAKDVKLHGVRILDCNGSGTFAGVIAGINYVANNAVKPAVANYSLSHSMNTSIDSAAASTVSRGIPFVAAAGDNNANACNYSPGRVASAITVGASTTTNTRAPYSNFGSCVDVYALGTRTGLGGTQSGTGVAAAYVSGCVALYLGGNPSATQTQVYNWVIANAPITGTIRVFTCPF